MSLFFLRLANDIRHWDERNVCRCQLAAGLPQFRSEKCQAINFEIFCILISAVLPSISPVRCILIPPARKRHRRFEVHRTLKLVAYAYSAAATHATINCSDIAFLAAAKLAREDRRQIVQKFVTKEIEKKMVRET